MKARPTIASSFPGGRPILLLACVFGGNVVALGWFAPNWLSGGLHSYGASAYAWLLLAVTVLSVSFILLGMAPAGRLRSRRA